MEFRIKRIYIDGYERIAVLDGINQSTEINVHFVRFGEYMESGGNEIVNYTETALTGELSIDLVCTHRKVKSAIMHSQPHSGSPYIKAVVDVNSIIDDFSVKAITSLCDNELTVHFEEKVSYKKGDLVYIEGSLELDEQIERYTFPKLGDKVNVFERC